MCVCGSTLKQCIGLGGVLVHNMGNQVYRPKKVAGINTSVRIDIDLYVEAKRRNINISAVTNQGLRGLLKGVGGDDLTEEAIAALVKERARTIESLVAQAAVDERSALDVALADLQAGWNVYMAAAPASTREAKLAWLQTRRENVSALSQMPVEALLAEMEGTSG